MVANEVPRLGDVSVLGLQHSVKLSRTEAPLEELQLSDVSVLGLQRSSKVLSQSCQLKRTTASSRVCWKCKSSRRGACGDFARAQIFPSHNEADLAASHGSITL